jgi:hypothetical protein
MRHSTLMMGEVRTQLLQNFTEIDSDLSAQVLGVRADERPRISLRPTLYALSPEMLSGIDCRLRSSSGPRTHGVGTARTRAVISGGRILQSSSYAAIPEGSAEHRMPWSHYLARPGVIELIGKHADHSDLATGFLGGDDAECLDLGAMSNRLMDRIQASRSLDRRPPFKISRTRFRWVAETTDGTPEAHFTLVSDTVRTLHLKCPHETGTGIVDVCEDLALHDWLLSSLITLSSKARIGATSPAELSTLLAPTINHLLHLWMPAAHVGKSLHWPWAALEENPGFTRQWRSSVDRIRDQIAINTLDLLSRGFIDREKRNHGVRREHTTE